MKKINSQFKIYLLFISVLVSGNIYYAQDTDEKPCSSSEARQFDFWVGEWDLEWTNAEGEVQKGTNIIKAILDGCVIEESFDGNPSMEFLGKSHSVYNERIKKWQQTWVDNSGGYLDFTGGMVNDKMILSREAKDRDGKDILQRMVFYNVTDNQLEWNWEKSDDGGKTWNLLWKIHYNRKIK